MEVIDLVTFKMNEHLRSESERVGGAHMSWFTCSRSTKTARAHRL